MKTRFQTPTVVAPGVMEQRLVYLEEIIDEAKNTIVGGDCARATQHTTSFHATAIALEDMEPGA